MSTPASLSIDCPAKINLALSVGLPTPQSAGLHPIASWMAPIALADQLTIRRLPNLPSRYDLAFHPDCPRPSPIDWPLEKDLCFRAHQLLQETLHRTLPIHLQLSKRIPTGAGLGGGSSDAAHTLLLLDQLFQLNLSTDTLADLAHQLGSDVPFFLRLARENPPSPNRTRSALVLDLGQRIQWLAPRSRIHLVLIFPPFATSTAAVYQAFDSIATLAPAPRQPDLARLQHLLRHDPPDPCQLFNDLTGPAFHVCPPLLALSRRLHKHLQRPIHLTGSGSTLFVLTRDQQESHSLAQSISELTGLPTLASFTI